MVVAVMLLASVMAARNVQKPDAVAHIPSMVESVPSADELTMNVKRGNVPKSGTTGGVS